MIRRACAGLPLMGARFLCRQLSVFREGYRAAASLELPHSGLRLATKKGFFIRQD
jgi:hypothetical protein